MRVLLIGGSGFLSGATARAAVAAGHQVHAVTRGQRPLPPGVVGLTADRRDPAAFTAAIAGAGATWDLAVDLIGFQAEDARADLAALTGRAGHLVFISTDFVFDPARRRFPQPEESEHYLTDGYGGGKRAAEEVLLASDGKLPWTVFRPNHIYGPGSKLGCLPCHARDPELLDRLRRGEPLRLVAAGSLLQQPILADDLAGLILSVPAAGAAAAGIFQAAGPEVVESVAYYQLIADQLGAPLTVEEVPLLAYRQAHPEHASFLCHRVYDLSRLRAAGLAAPATPLAEGLRQHVSSLL